MSAPAAAMPGGGGTTPFNLPPEAVRLPPLREELALLPGPRSPDGAPTWTLYDPARQRFFRIGWPEFEMLARWSLGRADALAEAVARETPLTVTAGQVLDFLRFLAGSGLLRPTGEAALNHLAAQAAAARLHWAKWLLKNYLFIRVPLVRPDRFLAALVPWIGWVYSRGFLAAVVLTALIGGWLALRQWDHFLHTLLGFFTPEGLVLFGAAMTGAKVLHELGHALTARRYGCRVPSMGVAFMVLWPVLYTDTSEAWKLPSRRRRLAIGAAGMAAELALAAAALLAWSFLPDGPARSAAFLLATSTWIVTLTVNLSPFMRFDGYYLLADAWDLPNLQDRAFALARWRLRERLFGFGEPPPETFPKPVRRRLIVYAVATWIYRFTLFLGIGLLVYEFSFKLLGIFLLMVELGWFIGRPIVTELAEWSRRRQRLRLNAHALTTLAAAGALAGLALVPWQGTVPAPALWRAAQQTALFAPMPAQVAEIRTRVGAEVREGEELFRLHSPDLAHRLKQTARQIETLRGQTALQVADRERLERLRVAWEEMEAALAEHAGHRAEEERLSVRAPIAGTMAEVADPLAAGEWLGRNEALAVLVDPTRSLVEAYVAEADLGRIAVGSAGTFVPESLDHPALAVRVTAIDELAARTLPEPDLASPHGGEIPVRQGRDGALVPDTPVYRVVLTPEPAAAAPVPRLRGRVHLAGERISLAARAWRLAAGVLVRESGF